MFRGRLVAVRISPGRPAGRTDVGGVREARATMIQTISLVIALLATTAAAPTPPSRTCEKDSLEPWVAGLHERVMAHDGLAKYAIGRFGSPVSCGGKVTSVFDGMEFGTLDLGFSNGATLQVETQPPEASRVTLSVPSGFPDEEEALQLMRTYVAHVGVEIDWSRPGVTQEGDTRTKRFESPESGTNASVETVFVDGSLIRLRFSMAL